MHSAIVVLTSGIHEFMTTCNQAMVEHLIHSKKQQSDSVSIGGKGRDNLDNVKPMYFAFFYSSDAKETKDSDPFVCNQFTRMKQYH